MKIKIEPATSAIDYGSKVYFKEDSRPYYFIGKNERFIIVARPVNKKYYYSIIDTIENIRGPDNLIFGPKYNVMEYQECRNMLDELLSESKKDFPEYHISFRHRIPLIITKITHPKRYE